MGATAGPWYRLSTVSVDFPLGSEPEEAEERKEEDRVPRWLAVKAKG